MAATAGMVRKSKELEGIKLKERERYGNTFFLPTAKKRNRMQFKPFEVDYKAAQLASSKKPASAPAPVRAQPAKKKKREDKEPETKKTKAPKTQEPNTEALNPAAAPNVSDKAAEEAAEEEAAAEKAAVPSDGAPKPAASKPGTNDGAADGQGLASSEDHKAEPEEVKTEPLPEARVMEVVKQGLEERIGPIEKELEVVKEAKKALELKNDALRSTCNALRDEVRSMDKKFAGLRDEYRQQDMKLCAQGDKLEDKLRKQGEKIQSLEIELRRAEYTIARGYVGSDGLHVPGLKEVKGRIERIEATSTSTQRGAYNPSPPGLSH